MQNQNFMLLEVVINCWTGSKKDKQTEQDINYRNNATDTGNFSKKLFKHDLFTKISSARAAAENYQKKVGLPWQSYEDYEENNSQNNNLKSRKGGNRIVLIPVSKVMEVGVEMNKYKDNFYNAVDNFISLIPSILSTEQVRLGDLFNILEYPNPEELRNRFKFRFVFLPLPQNDFRVSLTTEEVNSLKTQFEEDFRSKQEQCMKALWERMMDLTQDIVDIKEVKRIHSSRFEKVFSFIHDLPEYLIIPDSNLENFAKELKNRLQDVDIDTIRENEEEKNKLSEEVGNILDNMKGYVLQ